MYPVNGGCNGNVECKCKKNKLIKNVEGRRPADLSVYTALVRVRIKPLAAAVYYNRRRNIGRTRVGIVSTYLCILRSYIFYCYCVYVFIILL